ncbi:ABC transporter ATP-binding protein [Hoyosella sp. G463]|uniref:ABC transporter ATP-binding protein n=1 Tax=Lolliginicoccus lacisalsi TaxID=2742202 RepID=A0A927PL71_9ACTN|nr:ABC transporter ATP-binding protein [Lolliginicoccus lacisalsi]MBD8505087.1 ABC transporter ATP-binding protein [Lolliginicoccus lacisalsi]
MTTTTALDVALEARGIRSGYDRRNVVDGVSIAIPTGSITCLVGPNGSGKSTLLKSCARLLSLSSGAVYLGGDLLSALPSRAIAQRMAILPQGPAAPEQMTVRELVEQGRYPHAGPARMLRRQDHQAVADALRATGLSSFANRDVNHLSGGERQRAWIALALAQDTPILLLDEPTTCLDLGYQMDVLELVQKLNRDKQLTVVMVVHDLNHATAFADHLLVLDNGAIVAEGPPEEAITRDLLRAVFRVDADVITHPRTGKTTVLPVGSAH